MSNGNNVVIKTSLSPPKLSIQSINRISAVYNICYDMLKIFKAPKSTFRVIHDGIMDEHALKKITLYYISPDNLVEFMLILSIDWDVHDVIIQTSDGGKIQLNKRLSTLDQLVGDKEGFIQLRKEIFRTKRIQCRKVIYQYVPNLNSSEHDRIDKKLKLESSTDTYNISGEYYSYKISPSKLQETAITIRVRKDDTSPSAMRHLLNMLKLYWDDNDIL